jgi:hypothetical protein
MQLRVVQMMERLIARVVAKIAMPTKNNLRQILSRTIFILLKDGSIPVNPVWHGERKRTSLLMKSNIFGNFQGAVRCLAGCAGFRFLISGQMVMQIGPVLDQ